MLKDHSQWSGHIWVTGLVLPPFDVLNVLLHSRSWEAWTFDCMVWGPCVCSMSTSPNWIYSHFEGFDSLRLLIVDVLHD